VNNAKAEDNYYYDCECYDDDYYYFFLPEVPMIPQVIQKLSGDKI